MQLPQYLIRPSDSSFFELLDNGLYAKSSDVGKDYLFESHHYKALIDLGFREPSHDEIEEFEHNKEVEHYSSKSFQDNLLEQVKKDNWSVGLPICYMNELMQLVYEYQDGTVKIIKDLSSNFKIKKHGN